MKTKTYFALRIDIWDDTGNGIVDLLGGGCALAKSADHAAAGRAGGDEKLDGISG